MMRFRKDELFHHVCTLPPQEDVLFNVYPGTSWYTKFFRNFRRLFTVYEEHIHALKYYRSRSGMEKERERHMKSYYIIIHPFSKFRLVWDSLMLFVLLWAFLIVPIYAMYVEECPETPAESVLGYFDLFHCMICMADIIMNLITGYYNRKTGIVVLEPWWIILHYVKFGIWVDFFSSLPCDHFLCFRKRIHKSEFCRHMNKIRMLKCLRIVRLRKLFNHFMEQLGVPVILTEVISLSYLMYLVMHWVACWYHRLEDLSTVVYDRWEHYMQEIYTLQYDYIEGFYFAVMHFLTVDFGFSPHHHYVKKVIVASACLAGNIGYFFVLALSLRWKAINRAPSTKYEEVETNLKSYMRYWKLPRYVQNRVLEYYIFRWNRRFYDEGKIVAVLSPTLREEVMMISCRRLLESVSFFTDIPEPILMKISQCLKLEIYLVNDIIVKAGSVGNCMYFIASGTVCIMTTTGREVCHLEDGAHLGEVALVLDEQVRIANVVAVESCELYRLDRLDFKKAVAPYPDILMCIERIAEERLQHFIEVDLKRRRMRAGRQKN